MPVYFGDLAASGSPGVRLRVGESAVRLCCGGNPGPSLIQSWTAADPFIDQVTGAVYAPYVGTTPAFAPALGGLQAMTGGILRAPAAPGIPAGGLSMYALIGRPAASLGVGGIAAGLSRLGGGGQRIITGVDFLDRALGSVASTTTSTGLAIPAPTVPAAGAGVKAAISVHWLRDFAGPGLDRVEVRYNGALNSFQHSQPYVFTPDFLDMTVGGTTDNGSTPSGLYDPNAQNYRVLAYDTGVYDPAVVADLLALLP